MIESANVSQILFGQTGLHDSMGKHQQTCHYQIPFNQSHMTWNDQLNERISGVNSECMGNRS